MRSQSWMRAAAAVAKGERPADLALKNAWVVNVFTEHVRRADIAIYDGVIAGVSNHYEGREERDLTDKFVCPGFIDAHMHIESTMLLPGELAECVMPWGTTTIVADPHELVNVRGAAAMDFLLEAGEHTPMDILWMLPSSVPATRFETNGSDFTAEDMKRFAKDPRVGGLGEVMCFTDLLEGDPAILEKIDLMKEKVIDGHAPGLSGRGLQVYRCMGVRTEHECSSFEEAKAKLTAGFRVMIREGSAARNLTPIITGILEERLPTDSLLFCTDDKHIGDINREGHIRWNVKRAIELGMEPAAAIKIATLNAARAYGMEDRGAIAAGNIADIVVLDDLREVEVNSVYKRGRLVTPELFAEDRFVVEDSPLMHTVEFPQLEEKDIALPAEETEDVIGLVPDQIITRHLRAMLPRRDGFFTPNGTYSKLVVVERHRGTGNVAVAALKGYGITGGAVATTVAHDSHNIIAAGDNDRDILIAIERLRGTQGGYVLVADGKVIGEVALPICGLVSPKNAKEVYRELKNILEHARRMGVPKGCDPFVTLSFLALPVIPSLRLTDMGLFDADEGSFILRRT